MKLPLPAECLSATSPYRAAVPYVAPFAVFIFFIAVKGLLPLDAEWEYSLRVAAVSLALLIFSRSLLRLRVEHALSSVAMGALVFILWVGPDLLFPALREHWLFRNSLVGTAASSLPESARARAWFLFLRCFGSIILVSVVEEFFWRGWLMRWLIAHHFDRVPLGAWNARAFSITAVLFATEHGSYWDVGLIAGILYNWWVVRTRSLSACILAHAVTNALLALYVIHYGRWEYWL